jgi:hypothetical protein
MHKRGGDGVPEHRHGVVTPAFVLPEEMDGGDVEAQPFPERRF